MSQTDTIAELFRHYDWAEEKMLAATDGLSREQVDQPFDIGTGTLRKTFQHIHDSERVWIDRCTTNSSAAPEAPDPNQRIADIRRHAGEIAARRKALLNSLDDESINRTVNYISRGKPMSMRLADILLQICNHGMHHRAQAVNIFKWLGQSPPVTQYLLMQIESPGDPPPKLSLATLRDYISYTDWARDRVFGEASKLSDQQLDRPFDIGMGSIRKTLVHLNDADRWWLENWAGGGAGVFLQASLVISMHELKRMFDETSSQREQVLSLLTDDALTRPVSIQPESQRTTTFPLGHTIIEVCNHATHHRAHAMNMLRQVGITMEPIDYARMKARDTHA
jgi:uncharacterized damage-inducible protein DinB